MHEATHQELLAVTPGKANKVSDNPRMGRTSPLLRSISIRFKKSKGIYEQFFSLTKKLSRLFLLSKAVLIVRSSRNDVLKVIAMKGSRLTRQGLALTLPDKDSIFYSVFRKRKIYSEDLPGRFKGNFIERKLLLDAGTRSFAVSPIICDGSVMGLLCLTSPVPYTFSAFEDGVLEKALEPLGKVIRKETNRLSL
jgi:hypothetical protein